MTSSPWRWFSPLIAWLGRLSVGRKLTLIYLLDLTAVIYVSGILIHEKYLAIDFTRKEIVGVQYSTRVHDLFLPPFRASASLVTPPQDAWQRMEATRQQHDEDLAATEASAAWMTTLGQLQAMPAGPERQATLSRLARQGRELLTTVGNQSNLILDPDLDSYYAMSLGVLRFPELLEVLHDTARTLDGMSPEALRQGGRRTELLILAGRIDALILGIDSDYQQALAAGKAPLNDALRPGKKALNDSLLSLLASVRSLSEEGASGLTLATFQQAHGLAFQELDVAWRQVLESLNGLLLLRVENLYFRMWLHLGTALLLLGCILSLVYAVAQLIARPLRGLAQVADEVRRTGDHTRRAQWESRDEIGQLVTAFNGMLAQLDRERLTQQELAASARAAQTQLEMVEAIPIAMVVTSVPEHQVLHANAPALPWLAGRTADPWRSGLEPGVRARFFQRLADQGAVDEFEVRWQGGEAPSWAVLSARRLQFQGQDAVLTSFTPINMLKLMEQRLELWAKVFEASSEGILIMDANQRILSVNRAFCRSTSYDYYEVIGEQLGLLLALEESANVPPSLATALGERESWQGEVHFRKRSGESYPAWLMISSVRDATHQGEVSHYIGISVDITDRKRTEARVQFLAEHDVLTELPNRSLCVTRLREAMASAQTTGERVAVLFIDLDRFKNINDSLGHHIGDGLLRSVANRLNQSVRVGDTVSRLGGDEFVIIMRKVSDPDEVRGVVERRLIPQIRQAHYIEGHNLQVSCSVGVAVYPDDSTDLDELMRQADAAMYEAKSAGRDTARFFTPEIDLHTRERQVIEQYLRLALANQEMSVHYQPRVDARSLNVVGLEALLRWHHPVLGAVSPARFIPVAEETGLIHPIGQWVIQQACEQIDRWRRAGLPPMVVSVNLSAAQMNDPGLVGHLQSCLRANRIEPASLELEITESQIMDNAAASGELLQAFKALGVQLSIDDFGTGYSSLAYLKRFPIDKLKIDQSFVRDLLSDPADLSITRAIIALGHNLGLGVVAEGVETAEASEQLKALGCDELQGFYFARPMPAAQLEPWLRERQAPLERRRNLASSR
ncbi:EAL domain-containing protein [Curvibacter sp. HBC61]|uniref:EAL domain-containing protein n=1 Tax=Curvibacter cyanobacteriorum TaxID=3026422 RepID=A0ABT5MSH7_9BURK|nr:EAL domain-containing protein [Curvibacter sp. HBC61]MDD0837000.1 EAL domain-containing protein [Curvibacter sp. HBC61]